MDNLLKHLSNTRKRAGIPRGTATVAAAKKIVKNAPLPAKEVIHRIEKLGLGGKRKTRRRRHHRKH